MRSNKTKTICRVALLCFSLGAQESYSLPSGMQVVKGNTDVNASASNQQIQVSDKTIINWSDFSIGTNETVQFLQPDSSSVILNRVTGSVPSEILGSLLANGKVFLLNQNGIIFGKDSTIQVGSLLASTLDILDDAFLQGGDIVFSGDSSSQIVNLGTIKAPDGDVILIGRFIGNEGVIEAKHSYMAAAGEVLLKQSGSERIFIRPKDLFSDEIGIDNSGVIKALEVKLLADGNAYQYAIKDSGTIEATDIEQRDGRIFLVASQGRIDLTGSYLANDVQITGDKVYLADQANIGVSSSQGGKINIDSGEFFLNNDASLSATNEALGGVISLSSQRAAASYGTILANGSKSGGKVSINSLGILDIRSEIDVSSEGANGMICLSGNNMIITNDMLSEIVMGDTLQYSALAGFPSKLSSSFVQKALLNGNVNFTLSGEVSIHDDISWDGSSQGSGPTTFSVEASQILIGVEGARNAHVVSQDLDQNGTAINLKASHIQVGSVDRLRSSSVQAKSGDVVISVNDLHLQGGKNKANFSFDSTAKIHAASGNISIDAFAEKDLQIFLQGGSGKLSTAEISTIVGNISIQDINQSSAGLLSLKGGSGDNSNATISTLENGTISCLLPESSTIKLQGGSGRRSSLSMLSAAQKEGEGSLFIHAGKCFLHGGNGQEAGDVRAMLQARGDNQKINMEITKELTLQGGSALGDVSDARSILQTEEGAAIHVILAGKDQVDVNLLGGQGLISSALIETVGGGSILLQADPLVRKANFTMLGGSGEESSTALFASEKGDIKIDLLNKSFSRFEGGSSSGDSSVKIFTANGDMSFKGGSFYLQGGSGSGTNTVEICAEVGNIGIQAEGILQLEAGEFSLSSSAIYTSLGAVSVEAKGNIYLHATDEASSLIVSSGAHSIYTDGDIILQAPGKQKAYILNLSNEQGDGILSIEAKRGIEMHGNSLLQNQTDNLSVVSGENLVIKGSRIESLGKGAITLVADHQYEETGVAKGGLLFYKSSAIEGQGPVKIFTSERGLNVIDDVVNGVYFDPQRKYTNSSQEQWGSSYPDAYFGEQGFTIFYRENGTCESGEQTIFYLAAVLNDQLFYDLFTSYDERVDMETKFFIRKKKVKSLYDTKRHRWFYWSENLLPRRRTEN